MNDTVKVQKYIKKYPWPRRRFIRRFYKNAIWLVAGILTQWEIEGKENLPESGPLLIVGNHFNFLDTIAPIHSTQWPLEFIGDFVMPNAPTLMKVFPNSWQTLKIEQGTPNFEALNASEAVLAQNGVLVIYPEGHVHSGPLNPALPGAAYMALRTGAPILPMGTISDNNWKLFKTITEKKRRLGVRTRIGEVFGPLKSANPDRPSREEIREAGKLIMTKIAALLPKEFRGEFDPELV
ncbi:MAG: 1-acyl-sn-glycerol-3-phosphate acyltransferase [Anaerolineaceae bacterium]|jgi:1-acyl-sn-glycerol-3-phosphate acyltransferase|nr:1-acyl-sn-glycerol-3-phosphate acyltransferase [Anaerolineaceae bacterium]